MKRKYIILFLIIAVLLSGCGKTSPQEVQRIDINECFSNSDLLNCSRIDFISYEWDENKKEHDRKSFSCLCKHEDINTIFCKKLDFYESVYLFYKNVSAKSDYYTFTQVDIGEKEITQEGKSHYLQISLEEPITIALGEAAFEEIHKMLYDAEKGNLWLSDSGERYSLFASLSDKESNFKMDYQMIWYIEGEWERPQYDTIVEAIDYMINKKIKKTIDN